MCKRGFSVRFAPGLDSMSPARAGAPTAMLRGCMTGFQKKLGCRGSGEAGEVDTICTVPPL